MNICVPTIKIPKKNPTHSMSVREQLRKIRGRLPLPQVYHVKKMIIYVLKHLDIDSKTAKVVTIHALILIERIICSS